MKANEAPEKIQVHLIKDNYDDWSIRGYSFLEDKQIGMTEYIRTDAFIEKACKFLFENYHGEKLSLRMIDNFRKYLKENKVKDENRYKQTTLEK